MKQKLLWTMLVLSILAFAISSVIVVEGRNESKTQDKVCSATGSSCASVQQSKYGEVFGIKLGVLGLIGFLVLSLLIIVQLFFPNQYSFAGIMGGSLISGLAAVALIIIQAFVLQQYCVYCLIVDFSSIVILILTIIYSRQRALQKDFL